MNDSAKCPFCGSRCLVLSADYHVWNEWEETHVVVCSDCGARGPSGRTEEEALELWDQRNGIV